MSIDGVGDKYLMELNHQLRNGNKKDGVVSEEQNLTQDDGFKVDGIARNIKDGHEGALQSPSTALQIFQQQQSLGATVCWERFLHLGSLKVLLVENDYSTRHVVTALLRNCSYEVIEATNGLQAWRILEDLTNQIDLVLTEVVMPCLSGIGLLYKIMSHKTRKNVPVIMMSSHDSMGLVFKCLSKGAVDFLVKPIRKNELKNLWQHVWRRCHSSSGSGSESGTETQKSVKSKSVEKSGNDTGSSDEDDNGSIGLNVGDGSDNGSGTQSSWTKQAVEVDSPRPVSPMDQVAECPDSTCAQVIHSNAEVSGTKQTPIITAKECEEQEEQLDSAAAKDLEKVVPGNVDLQLECQVADPIKFVGTKQKNLLERGSGNYKEKIDKEQLDQNSENPSSKSRYEAANLTGFTTNTIDPHMDSTEIEATNRHCNILDIKNKPSNDAKEIPTFELSLKRNRGAKDVGTVVQEDRNVLRRSDSSAFSRYNASSNAKKAPCANMTSGSHYGSSLDVTEKGTVCDLKSHSNSNLPNHCSNVGSNNIDMGSTTNHAITKSVVLKNKSGHPPSTFQAMRDDPLCATQQILKEKADDTAGAMLLAQPGGSLSECKIQHQTHHYNHYHHLPHNMQTAQQCQQKQLPPEHDDSSLKKMAAAVPHCGSSNVLGGPLEGNGGNYSINGSASGSNHGSNHVSNGQNGSSTAVNAGGTNVESDNGIGGKSGSGDGSGEGNRGDQNKFSQREVALTKFRQKRKERCFRKKWFYVLGSLSKQEEISRATTTCAGTICAADRKWKHKQSIRELIDLIQGISTHRQFDIIR
ncbi:two-component response regulator-like APRR7 isoform X2 [Ricinus communis]|uniref:two-component response regulator-like APRR7 isoform X2 n=1 Tax=Ricinus communis TaxID=3988 RepID=UPI00201A6A9E|nr:two-component response regulator-like APRR7 isoform X2 [Ricinus communis]